MLEIICIGENGISQTSLYQCFGSSWENIFQLEENFPFITYDVVFQDVRRQFVDI